MDKIYQAPAQISKITTMSDKTLRLQVDCQEISPDEEALIFSTRNKLGYFAFAEREIKVEDLDLPDFVKEFKDEKTPSQRLRNTLFVLHEQTDTKESFDDFYKRKIEEIITHFKNKLTPRD